MVIIKKKNSTIINFMFSNTEDISLTPIGLLKPIYTDAVNSNSHEILAVPDPPALPSKKYWLYDGGWVFRSEDHLEELRSEYKKLLASIRYQKESSGVLVGSNLIDTDRVSQAMLVGISTAFAKNPNKTIKYKSKSGWVTIDSPSFDIISEVVTDHVQSCFEQEALLSSAIDTATTSSEILAIDLTVGWPN